MSDKEMMDHLRKVILSEAGGEVIDQEVDELMSGSSDVPQEVLERMRERFVSKVFDKLLPEPVRQVNDHITFGQWIKMLREKARLTHSFIATALKKPYPFIEQLENGTIFPWQMSSSDAADIAILFRMHEDALTQLTSNFAISLSSKNQLTEKVAFTSRQIAEWQDTVRIELRRRQATYLLRQVDRRSG